VLSATEPFWSVMKQYELDAEQKSLLEKAFLMMPAQDGVQQKLEAGSQSISQLAKRLMILTVKSKEQNEMLTKLIEVNQWFKDAVMKHEF